MTEADIKRLVQSRRGYRAHFKRLFTTINELMERCNSTEPEEEDADTLSKLLVQLERKKAILTDLDTRIGAIINEDELETEVLESEDLQMDISNTISKGKRLQKRLQPLGLSSSLYLPLRISQLNLYLQVLLSHTPQAQWRTGTLHYHMTLRHQ